MAQNSLDPFAHLTPEERAEVMKRRRASHFKPRKLEDTMLFGVETYVAAEPPRFSVEAGCVRMDTAAATGLILPWVARSIAQSTWGFLYAAEKSSGESIPAPSPSYAGERPADDVGDIAQIAIDIVQGKRSRFVFRSSSRPAAIILSPCTPEMIATIAHRIREVIALLPDDADEIAAVSVESTIRLFTAAPPPAAGE